MNEPVSASQRIGIGIVTMGTSEFVGYVGPPQLHDGRILRFSHRDGVASVLVEGDDGRQFTLEFEEVVQVEADRPEGMRLYALSEMTARSLLRRYVFANWDDEDPRRLELTARGFRLLPGEPPVTGTT